MAELEVGGKLILKLYFIKKNNSLNIISKSHPKARELYSYSKSKQDQGTTNWVQPHGDPLKR